MMVPKRITGRQIYSAFTVFILSMLFALLPTNSPAALYYVDSSNGNNSNSGSVGQPWQTIQYAVDHVTAGDTVFIRGGTYQERVMLTGSTGSEGESGNEVEGYISYIGYPGETVILDGSSFSWGSAFKSGKWAEGARVVHYIRVKNLTVQGYPASGIGFESNQEDPNNSVGSHNIIIENVTTHDNEGEGILFEGGDEAVNGESYDIEVKNCVSYSNNNHGIKFTGDDAGVIDREHIYNSSIENCEAYDNNGIGIHVSTGHYNITVKHNTAYNNARAGLAGHEIWDSIYEGNISYSNGWGTVDAKEGIVIWLSKNITIKGNKLYDNQGYGLYIWQDFDNSDSSPIILNNLIYDNSKDGLYLAESTYNATVYNNTIISNISNGIKTHSSGYGHIIKNNIFANNGLTLNGSQDLDYNLYSSNISFSGKGVHAITDDPLFSDPSQQDYTLQQNSPAIDAGTDVGLARDFRGTPIPQGSAPDMGAFEFVQSGGTPEFGDVDGNGDVQAYDASLTLLYSVGMDPLSDTDPRPWSSERIDRADVDGNSELQAYDAALIQQFVIGEIDTFPAQNQPSSIVFLSKKPDKSSSEVDNSSQQDSLLSFAQTEDTVDIRVHNLSNVYGVNLSISFDASAIELGTAQKTGISEDYYMVNFTPESGRRNIGLMAAIPPDIDGSFLRLPFVLFHKRTTVRIQYVVNSGDTISQDITITPTTSFHDINPLPLQNQLTNNYPNPFNATTTIPYTVQSRSKVILAIYNMTGSLVKTLVNKIQNPGIYRIRWDGTDSSSTPLATGIYFVKVDIGANYQAVKRIVLLK